MYREFHYFKNINIQHYVFKESNKNVNILFLKKFKLENNEYTILNPGDCVRIDYQLSMVLKLIISLLSEKIIFLFITENRWL